MNDEVVEVVVDEEVFEEHYSFVEVEEDVHNTTKANYDTVLDDVKIIVAKHWEIVVKVDKHPT